MSKIADKEVVANDRGRVEIETLQKLNKRESMGKNRTIQHIKLKNAPAITLQI